MSERQYKIADLPRGQRGKVVAEFAAGEPPLHVLWLPAETPPETQFEIVQAIQRAYQAGRDDRECSCCVNNQCECVTEDDPA